jgi:hypothetical protein
MAGQKLNLTFEWYEEKAGQNLKKHNISFEEAKTVFNDPFSLYQTLFIPMMNSVILISGPLQRDEF